MALSPSTRARRAARALERLTPGQIEVLRSMQGERLDGSRYGFGVRHLEQGRVVASHPSSEWCSLCPNPADPTRSLS